MTGSEPSTGHPDSLGAALKSVLIIEDNVLNMRLFGAMLSAEGYLVIEAKDGPSGLETAGERRPDLIVLDVHLPGLSGLEVRRRLRVQEETQHIPILVTTADPMPGLEQELRASEYDGYIEKPMAVSEFLALVDWLMLRSQIAAEVAA